MAAFMYRLAGKPAFNPPAVSPFADVTKDNIYYHEITWLAAQDISTGWSEAGGTKTFRPLQEVNRDAMAAFMYRFASKFSAV
jgi:serine protease